LAIPVITIRYYHQVNSYASDQPKPGTFDGYDQRTGKAVLHHRYPFARHKPQAVQTVFKVRPAGGSRGVDVPTPATPVPCEARAGAGFVMMPQAPYFGENAALARIHQGKRNKVTTGHDVPPP
jgi:hypothetical protein